MASGSKFNFIRTAAAISSLLVLLTTISSRSALHVAAQAAASASGPPYTTVPQRATPIVFDVPPPPTLPANLSSVPGLEIQPSSKVATEFDQHLPFTSKQATGGWNKMVGSLETPLDYGKILGMLPNTTGAGIDYVGLLSASWKQVGAIIGVLALSIIVAIVTFLYAIVFICCRCCCGKKDSAKFDQNPRTTFRLVCTVILLASAAIAFSLAIVIDVNANNAVTNMGHMPPVVDGVLGGMSWYISSTFDQFADTVNWALSHPDDKSGAFDLVMSDLANIGDLVGGALSTKVNAALGSKLTDLQTAVSNIMILQSKGNQLKADDVALSAMLTTVNSLVGYVSYSGTTHTVIAGSFADGVYTFCGKSPTQNPGGTAASPHTCTGSCATFCGTLNLDGNSGSGVLPPLTTILTTSLPDPDTVFAFLGKLDKITTAVTDSSGKSKLDTLSNPAQFIHDKTITQVANAQNGMTSVETNVVAIITDARKNALGLITTMIDQLRSGLSSTSSMVASYSHTVNYVGVILMLLCLITPIVGTVCAVLGFLFFHSQVPPDKRNGLGNASGKGLVFTKWFNICCNCIPCILFAVLFCAVSLVSVVFCSLFGDQAGNFTQLANVESRLITLTNLSIPFDLQKTLVGCMYNEALLEVVDLDKLNIHTLNKDAIRSQLSKFDAANLQQQISDNIKFDSLTFTIDGGDVTALGGAGTDADKVNVAFQNLPPNAMAGWSTFYAAFLNYPSGSASDNSIMDGLKPKAAAIDVSQKAYATQTIKVKADAADFGTPPPSGKLTAASNALTPQNQQSFNSYLQNNIKTDVTSVIKDFIARTTAVLQSVTDHLIYQIFDNVGRCRPLFEILMTLVDLLCGGTLAPLAGLAAAVLVVFLFYIPMWITADRLAFLYRRHKVLTFAP